MGFFRVSKNQKSGKCHELPRKSKTLKQKPVGGGGSFRGSKNQRSGKFHNMNCRENLYILFNLPRGWREGEADRREGTGWEKGRGRQAGKEGPERSRVTS